MSEIASVSYSPDGVRKARVIVEANRFFVDFYKNNVMIESKEYTGHSLSYVEDVAENYVLGVLDIESNKMEN